MGAEITPVNAGLAYPLGQAADGDAKPLGNSRAAKCAFPPGCSCLQLSEPLLGGEATQGHVAPAAVIDPQVGRQQLIASR